MIMVLSNTLIQLEKQRDRQDAIIQISLELLTDEAIPVEAGNGFIVDYLSAYHQQRLSEMARKRDATV